MLFLFSSGASDCILEDFLVGLMDDLNIIICQWLQCCLFLGVPLRVGLYCISSDETACTLIFIECSSIKVFPVRYRRMSEAVVVSWLQVRMLNWRHTVSRCISSMILSDPGCDDTRSIPIEIRRNVTMTCESTPDSCP